MQGCAQRGVRRSHAQKPSHAQKRSHSELGVHNPCNQMMNNPFGFNTPPMNPFSASSYGAAAPSPFGTPSAPPLTTVTVV